MRLGLKELLELLNVGHILAPYETCPWNHYDPDKGETCSAEVRMGIDGNDLEAEIQRLYDEPRDGRMIEQVMWLRAAPKEQGRWTVTHLRIRGEDKTGAVYDWETKICTFFTACTTAILLESIPDFGALLEEHFHDNEGKSGGGRGGRKAPKANMNQVLGMKQGGSF